MEEAILVDTLWSQCWLLWSLISTNKAKHFRSWVVSFSVATLRYHLYIQKNKEKKHAVSNEVLILLRFNGFSQHHWGGPRCCLETKGWPPAGDQTAPDALFELLGYPKRFQHLSATNHSYDWELGTSDIFRIIRLIETINKWLKSGMFGMLDMRWLGRSRFKRPEYEHANNTWVNVLGSFITSQNNKGKS